MSQNSNSIRIVMAAGGTGGHLFPAVAVAEAVMGKSSDSRCLFITTGKELEKKILEPAGFEMRTISVSGIAGLGIYSKIKAILKIPAAVLKSAFILKKFRADVVVGMGSYTAAPVLVAAKFLGIPAAIHEQNRRPGITNRIMSKYAGRIYSSFEDTFPEVDSSRFRYFGNPVRRSIIKFSEEDGHDNKSVPEKFRILVLGGSQGSRSINRSIESMILLLDEKSGIEFVHQTGIADFSEVRTAYESCGIKADVQPFFNDMGKIYSEADLVVCRSGASTVAELSVMGKPAIFIPFSHAAGGHQGENAEALENSGAAVVIEEDRLVPELLLKQIMNLKESPEVLKRMSEASASTGKPDAAKYIADDIMDWIESKI